VTYIIAINHFQETSDKLHACPFRRTMTKRWLFTACYLRIRQSPGSSWNPLALISFSYISFDSILINNRTVTFARIMPHQHETAHAFSNAFCIFYRRDGARKERQGIWRPIMKILHFSDEFLLANLYIYIYIYIYIYMYSVYIKYTRNMFSDISSLKRALFDFSVSIISLPREMQHRPYVATGNLLLIRAFSRVASR